MQVVKIQTCTMPKF